MVRLTIQERMWCWGHNVCPKHLIRKYRRYGGSYYCSWCDSEESFKSAREYLEFQDKLAKLKVKVNG